MGVYSEMAADLRDDVQERTTAVQDAAELAARRADERQQAEEEQAIGIPPMTAGTAKYFPARVFGRNLPKAIAAREQKHRKFLKSPV